jgi:nicotinamide-nucleotide amidase
LEAAVLDRLGERVYSLDGRGLEQVVVDLLREQRLDLAVAESCTGGLLASRVTRVPGASEAFKGGVITYSDEMKELLLEVPPFVLKHAGAVSKDCALAMAVGLARKLDADYSLAITGIAGPTGGSGEKPVGTVHIALAGPAGVRHQRYEFRNSDRVGVQARAAQAALWLLYCALADIDTQDEGTDRGGYQSA